MQKKCPSLGSVLCWTCSLRWYEALPENKYFYCLNQTLTETCKYRFKYVKTNVVKSLKTKHTGCKLWSPTQEPHTSSSSLSHQCCAMWAFLYHITQRPTFPPCTQRRLNTRRTEKQLRPQAEVCTSTSYNTTTIHAEWGWEFLGSPEDIKGSMNVKKKTQGLSVSGDYTPTKT